MAAKTCCRNMQDREVAKGRPASRTCCVVNAESPECCNWPFGKLMLCNGCVMRFTQGTLSKVSINTCSASTWLLHSRHSVHDLLQMEGSQHGVNVKCSQIRHTRVLLNATQIPPSLLVSCFSMGSTHCSASILM